MVNRTALAVSHYRNVPFANCTGGGGACTLAKLFGCKIASSESKYLRRTMLHDACSSATCNAQARVLHPAHWALRDECCSACCAAIKCAFVTGYAAVRQAVRCSLRRADVAEPAAAHPSERGIHTLRAEVVDQQPQRRPVRLGRRRLRELRSAAT